MRINNAKMPITDVVDLYDIQEFDEPAEGVFSGFE